jgi:hypothetical protein
LNLLNRKVLQKWPGRGAGFIRRRRLFTMIKGEQIDLNQTQETG